jgi:CubicO group peptidase (beta-lactamase class C family)
VTDFRNTSDFLAREVESATLTRGVQVCVVVDGAVAFEAALGDAGIGKVASNTLFRIYCASKPIAAVAAAGLVDDGHVDLDAPLARVLPSVHAFTAGVTLRHLLTHTAGLFQPDAFSFELIPDAQRARIVDHLALPAGWRLGRDAAYSDYVGWHLIGRALEALTGRPLRELLRDRVLDPFGMKETFIGMTDGEFAANTERIGTNFDLRHGRSLPLLLERARRWCIDCNCAHGGYTTARDLARFYSRLLDQLETGGDPGLPSPATLARFCRAARPQSYDRVLQRECDYGLGFMVNLAEHQFGEPCTPASFGHSGWLGGSFAFADPPHRLAVAVVLNGIVDHEISFARRQALVGALYDDLGITTPPAPTVSAAVSGAPPAAG